MFVRMWMTKDPVTAGPKDTLSNALAWMERGRFRRLPVVDRDKLVGMITLPQVREALAKGRLTATVGEFMTADPQSVSLDDPIEDVAARMRERKVGAFPVLKGAQLVGIITESNLFDAFTRILGAGQPGIRVTFDLAVGAHEITEILETARAHGMEIVSLTSYDDLAGARKTVNVRVRVSGLDRYLDALWKGSFRILKVIRDDKPVDPPK